MYRACAAIAAITVVAAAIAGFAATASAHARVKSSTPGKGEVVQTSPTRVEIYFTQAIQKVSGTYGIEVARDRGAAVTTGPAVIAENDRTHLTVTLQPDLTPGRYVVQWKNVSDEDGDPAEGAFSFYFQKEPNTVDLANDAQLEQIGAESPEAGTTEAPAGSATPVPAGTATRPVPTPTATSPSSGDGGDNNVLYFILGGVGAGLLIGLGGWWLYTRRRT